jgi:hypothetical protein
VALAQALEAAVKSSATRSWAAVLAGLCASGLPQLAVAESQVLVVAGLGGEPQFDERFRQWGETIAKSAATLGAGSEQVQVLVGAATKREALEQKLNEAAQRLRPGDNFVLVLIGHGSFDGAEYRFNISGPDLTGTQMVSLLDKISPQVPQLVVNATSASGAVAEKWAKPHRVVITATRTGGERNATRFAKFWAEAVSTDGADRDKDGAVTAQEAYDFTVRKVGESFKADAAVVTEHAKLVGTGPGAIIVARRGSAAMFANDAELRTLRTEQGGIEQRLMQLKPLKSTVSKDDYFNRIEPVLIELARLNERIDARLTVLGAAPQGSERATPQ